MPFLVLALVLGAPDAGLGAAPSPSGADWSALLPDLSLGLQYQNAGAPFAADGNETFRLSATTALLVEARWPLAALEGRSTSTVWSAPSAALRGEEAGGLPSPPSKPGEPETTEPSVAELQQAAEESAAVRLGELVDWRGRARSSALLPELTAEYRRTVGDVDTYGIRSEVGIDSHNLENLARYEVRATWQLSQLVFSREEILAATSALEVQRSRQELLTRIADHYYERRRLQLLLGEPGPGSTRERQELQLRIDQQTATLDALTAGYLSRALAGRGAGRAQ